MILVRPPSPLLETFNKVVGSTEEVQKRGREETTHISSLARPLQHHFASNAIINPCWS